MSEFKKQEKQEFKTIAENIFDGDQRNVVLTIERFQGEGQTSPNTYTQLLVPKNVFDDTEIVRLVSTTFALLDDNVDHLDKEELSDILKAVEGFYTKHKDKIIPDPEPESEPPVPPTDPPTEGGETPTEPPTEGGTEDGGTI